jgi:prepilin-type N-terminal cleavage/methylation domain-containing protein
MTRSLASIRRQTGFTLVEVTVSLAVFALIAVISASTLTRMTSFYTDSLFRSGLMESAKVAQESALDELKSARVLSVGTSGGYPVVTYVVPVLLPNGISTDYFDSSGNVNWGCLEASGPMRDATGSPHRVSLTVTPTSTVEEKKMWFDVNGDGDLQDTFQLGSLVFTTSGGQKRTLIAGRLLISEVGVGAFDMNKDQVADRVLQVSGEPFVDANLNGMYDSGEVYTDLNQNGYWDGSLVLNLLTFATDRDGRGQSYYYQASVRFANN